MCLIHGEYHELQAAALLPIELTADWRIEEAEIRLSPILATTFDSNKRALLVVAHEPMLQGEVSGGHGEGARISVHLFNRIGGVWRLGEQGDEVAEAGSYGYAPTAELLRLGAQKWGVALDHGYLGMGVSFVFRQIIALDEPEFPKLLELTLHEDNGGTCSEEHAERESLGLQPCASYDAEMSFQPELQHDYDLLHVVYRGTAVELKHEWQVRDRHERVCYRFDGEQYRQRDAHECADDQH